MGSSWQYPRWRRILMQAIMWLILGATVGLAFLVDYRHANARRVVMGDVQTFGDLRLKLPAKWRFTAGQGVQVLIASEPSAKGEEAAARTLIVERHRIGGFPSPLEFMVSLGLLGTSQIDPILQGQGAQRITVNGYPGVQIAYTRELRQTQTVRKGVLACAVLPSRQAIVVRLEGAGAIDPADEEVVKAVAESIALDDQPPPSSAADRVTLRGGATVPQANGFQWATVSDPNRLTQQMLYSDKALAWASIEAVPCLWLNDKPEAFLNMLAMRDAAWLGAKITPQDEVRDEALPRVWRIDMEQAGADALFPQRAFAAASRDGQAVLLIGRCGARENDLLSGALAGIAKGVRFAQPGRLAMLLENGAQEAQRLRGQTLEHLLSGGNEQGRASTNQVFPDKSEEWWMWAGKGQAPYLGWMHVVLEHQDKWDGLREMGWRGVEGRIHRIVQGWGSVDDLNAYEAQFEFASARADVEEETLRPTHGPRLALADGKIAVLGSKIRIDAPAQYVPGTWLPLLVGQLAARPMLLRTECFVDAGGMSFANLGGVQFPELLALVIDPGKTPENDPAGAMRCVTLEINGTGEITRWYFNEKDGTLASVDLPDGVRRVPYRDPDAGFSDDARLKPPP